MAEKASSAREAEVAAPQDESNAVENEEVVTPQSGAEEEELAAPQNESVSPEDIAGMSSEEFQKYLDELDGIDEPIPEEQTAEQTDEAPEPEPETGEEPAAAPFKTFATEDEYNADRDEYAKQRTNEAFGKRFKEDREKEDLLSEIRRTAGALYGDSDDAVERMLNDVRQSAADQAGMSVEDFTAQQNDRRDAENWRNQQKQQSDMESRRNAKLQEWSRDAQNLKSVDPEFDFDKAMQDKVFYNAIVNGRSVFDAYGELKKKPEPPKQAKRKPITQNAQTPSVGTGISTRNPASLSSEDFRAYINKIKNS